MNLKPNPSILDIQPYKAGEGKIAGHEKVLKLASNENPLGASVAAVQAFQEASADISLYPDPSQKAVREALAQVHNLSADELIVSNGSEALLDLFIRTYAGPGDEVLYPRYSFPIYPIATRAAGATPVEADVKDWGTDIEALLAAVTDRTKVVVVANPNNPTGTWVPKSDLTRLRMGLRGDILLIIDSAYAEYMEDEAYSAGHDLVSANQNVIVTRTLSKAYGLASARVGWAHAPAEVLGVASRIKSVFPVTGPSQAAAVAALHDQAHVRKTVALNNRLLPWFQEELNDRGIDTPKVIGGNFVLGLFGNWGGAAKADACLRAHGMTARLVGVPEGLRISLGLEDDMKRVLAALDEG
ncbi:MAG: histidinol-phosphate transaminase [Sphingomonadales bacterium]|jgi:histidinol-phosphate aminotransferase